MKLTNILTSVAILAATTSGMPTAEVSSSESAGQLFARADSCGTSSFVKETSSGSAGIEDCIKLADKFKKNNKSHSISTTRKEILREGNCRFVAVADANNVKMGNQDGADVIISSIGRFAGNGRVGARGVMHCTGGNQGTGKVSWWIWKT